MSNIKYQNLKYNPKDATDTTDFKKLKDSADSNSMSVCEYLCIDWQSNRLILESVILKSKVLFCKLDTLIDFMVLK